jgi:NADPH-dependent 2,4-dienoyl-CoA reductase/sulfur reductase-like enzyme
MKVVIIGNGIAGITAAITIRKLSDYHLTVISSESDYFFSRTALMYVYMGHMTPANIKPYEDWFWKENKINLLRAHVESVHPETKSVLLQDGSRLPYDHLLISTGSVSLRHEWPGQDLEGVQSLYGLPDLEQMEARSPGIRRAVIVGGGLTGIEMAEMFHTRHIPVTLLVRDSHYWGNVLPEEEALMVAKEISRHGIDLRLDTGLQEILGDEKGKVQSVVSTTGENIPCDFVGVTIGVKPNIAWLQGSPVETARGVLVNQYLETNVEQVYAAGDCAEFADPGPGQPPVEQLWYTGRMQGETVAYNICGQRKKYERGVWFNSAKFFTMEFQTYGQLKPRTEVGESSLFWRHPQGRKSIRITYHEKSGVVTGFTLMGVRYRHEVCDRWIREGRVIGQVLQHLGEANFDPEFFRQHEQDLLNLYNRKHPDQNLTLKRKRGLTSLFSRKTV